MTGHGRRVKSRFSRQPGRKGWCFLREKIQAYDSGPGFIDVASEQQRQEMSPEILISPNTTIQGTLAPDVYVLVIGTINTDYSFTAKEIRVLAALEIKPDERKLAITQSATFTVKLRERPSSAVSVALRWIGRNPGGIQLDHFEYPCGGADRRLPGDGTCGRDGDHYGKGTG